MGEPTTALSMAVLILQSAEDCQEVISLGESLLGIPSGSLQGRTFMLEVAPGVLLEHIAKCPEPFKSC
eukprot:3223712-Rhodomonas_salina.1